MERLSSYYNHDTTEILNKIVANGDNLYIIIDRLENTVDGLKTLLLELKEYGVKVRKE